MTITKRYSFPCGSIIRSRTIGMVINAMTLQWTFDNHMTKYNLNIKNTISISDGMTCYTMENTWIKLKRNILLNTRLKLNGVLLTSFVGIKVINDGFSLNSRNDLMKYYETGNYWFGCESLRKSSTSKARFDSITN